MKVSQLRVLIVRAERQDSDTIDDDGLTVLRSLLDLTCVVQEASRKHRQICATLWESGRFGADEIQELNSAPVVTLSAEDKESSVPAGAVVSSALPPHPHTATAAASVPSAVTPKPSLRNGDSSSSVIQRGTALAPAPASVRTAAVTARSSAAPKLAATTASNALQSKLTSTRVAAVTSCTAPASVPPRTVPADAVADKFNAVATSMDIEEDAETVNAFRENDPAGSDTFAGFDDFNDSKDSADSDKSTKGRIAATVDALSKKRTYDTVSSTADAYPLLSTVASAAATMVPVPSSTRTSSSALTSASARTQPSRAIKRKVNSPARTNKIIRVKPKATSVAGRKHQLGNIVDAYGSDDDDSKASDATQVTPFTAAEDGALVAAMTESTNKGWLGLFERLAENWKQRFGIHRSSNELNQRGRQLWKQRKSGIAWTPEQDELLLSAIRRLGFRWIDIAAALGFPRDEKHGYQVKSRWTRDLSLIQSNFAASSAPWNQQQRQQLMDAAELFWNAKGATESTNSAVQSWRAVSMVCERAVADCQYMWHQLLDGTQLKSEEDKLIVESIVKHGYCWRHIATALNHKEQRGGKVVEARWREVVLPAIVNTTAVAIV